METTKANLKGHEILGSGNRLSDQEILSRTLKRWGQRLGYASIFATIPALVISQAPGVLADETKMQEVNVAGRTAKLAQRVTMRGSNPGLLKRQSAFRLPHQKGNFVMAALAGNDDCPGAAIPGGSYTAAAPFVTTGDTTGANDTISTIPSYYYSSYGAFGPDHVYSFTLTGFGPNPRIEVSTTSSTYRPLIYVMDGRNNGGCPAGTGNFEQNWPWATSDSRWTNGNTATVYIDYLPLNVPFHLLVDSQSNDAAGSGAYTIRMQDVTIAPAAPCSNANPIDCSDFFIGQQYRDFLGREAEPAGLQFYLDILNGCNS